MIILKNSEIIAPLLLLMCCLFSTNLALANEINSKASTLTFGNELLIEWDSPEGILRLQKSDAKENFWKLLRFYDSQTRLTYCGIATAVIALNALAIEAPQSKFLGKYRMFTQEEFFSDNVCAVIDHNQAKEHGLALHELEVILKTFPTTQVIAYEAQSLSHEEIRNLLITSLRIPNQFALALYQRTALKQEGAGHWSPIAAYDTESDSFLLLDVAKFKYPPVWIDATTFINAMQTANAHGYSRGFIMITKDK